MKKIYCYAALIISFSLLFSTLKSSYYLLSIFLFMVMMLISSKVYKFQEGNKIKDSYQKLPMIRLSSFIFRDSGIMNSQNFTSLNVFFFSAAFGLSMIISFYFQGDTTRHFLLLFGCLAFSLLFVKMFLKRYVI
jgi:hypothetical protein